jgi:5-aminopentanamidase
LVAEVIRADFTGGAPTPTQAVATLNLGPKPGDPEHNLLMAGRAVREAKRLRPDLRWVVLPELFTCGYSALETVHLFAESAERGRSAGFFVSLARELGIYIAYGFPETVPGPAAGVFDSANLVGAGGVIATYRKRNLVETTPEYRVFTPGLELPVVEAGGLRVALAICWDMGFPEVAREAAARGADLVLAPAAWREPWGHQYELSCASRALDSGIYLASANQIGDYPEARFGAMGRVYGPDGARISRGFGATSLADLDPEVLELWRGFYGDTLVGRERVAIIQEEPLENCS